jgi:hypothetical protein
LPDPILFSYSFTDSEDVPAQDMIGIVRSSLESAQSEYESRLQLTVDRIFAEVGSVIIVIVVSSVALKAGGGIALRTLGSWAADRFFGGVIGQLGKSVPPY